MDVAQHAGGSSGVRPRPAAIARQGLARGQPEYAAAGSRSHELGGAVHPGGARAPDAAGGQSMKPRPILAIVLRQLYLLRQSPVRVFGLIVWVTIDIVLWGFITRYLNTVSGSGVNFVPTLLGAVLLWDFSERIMQGVSTAFLEDVWSRNFLSLFSSPLSIAEYISGLVLTSMLTSSLGLVAMLIVALGAFHLELFTQGLPLAAFVLVLLVFGITLR